MMRRYMFVLLCFVLLLLPGCAKEEEMAEHDILVYALDGEKQTIVGHGYQFQSTELDARIEELFTELQTSHRTGRYYSAITQSMSLERWSYSVNGTLICYFSNAYNNLDGAIEVLSRAAVVRTLTQLPEIKSIEYIVGGSALLVNNYIVGAMNEDTFVYSIETKPMRVNATLYFADPKLDGLVATETTLFSDEAHTMEWLVVDSLIKGPVEEDVVRTVPEQTEILSVITRDSTCYVDLSEGFLRYLEAVPPYLTIYSIVNSLCDLGGINSVVISVEGSTNVKYLSVELSHMFERNFSYIIQDKED